MGPYESQSLLSTKLVDILPLLIRTTLELMGVQEGFIYELCSVHLFAKQLRWKKLFLVLRWNLVRTGEEESYDAGALKIEFFGKLLKEFDT